MFFFYFLALKSEEIIAENRKMEDAIKENKRKCTMITDAINNLEVEYVASKIYFPMRRYPALKQIIKRTIHDQLIRES